MKRYTLPDIARELGLSVTTISRALNDKPDISPQTKRMVQEKARALGYVSNSLARDFRRQRTTTLGVVISDNANPFFARVVRGIQSAASAKGYQIILCNTDEEYTKEVASIQLFQQTCVAGMLITPVQTEEQSILDLVHANVPFVLINRHFANINTDFVVGADEMGGYLATTHLVERGYKHVWHIGGPSHISPASGRVAGYRKALSDHGIGYDGARVIHGQLNMDDGHRATKRILAQTKPPFGIFCFSDYVAIGAMSALLEEGVAIPDDVAVVGYDNIEFAPYLRIPLTSIDNPRYQVGTKAADLLVDLIEGRAQPRSNHIILEPALIVRSST